MNPSNRPPARSGPKAVLAELLETHGAGEAAFVAYARNFGHAFYDEADPAGIQVIAEWERSYIDSEAAAWNFLLAPLWAFGLRAVIDKRFRFKSRHTLDPRQYRKLRLKWWGFCTVYAVGVLGCVLGLVLATVTVVLLINNWVSGHDYGWDDRFFWVGSAAFLASFLLVGKLRRSPILAQFREVSADGYFTLRGFQVEAPNQKLVETDIGGILVSPEFCRAQDSFFFRALVTWLNNEIPESLPAGVRGFAFNRYEHLGEFKVELVGTPRFDPSDPDWACDEAWEPGRRQLVIPAEFSGGIREACARNVRTVLEEYLRVGERGGVLAAADGIGLGYVDGDMEVISGSARAGTETRL